MVRFGNIDFASLAVEGLSSAVAGGIQEWGWRGTGSKGWMITGAALLGGLAMKTMGNSPLMGQIGNAVFLSGAAVSGMQASKKFMGGPAAYLPSGYRANSYTPARAIPAYGNVSLPPASVNRTPRVSVSTVNPGTGEQILSSRV